ncbi:MAG: L,D-transpeptidase family protein [Gordonia sp. (in: high G+C Gram-positive bacteria)]
MLRLGLVAVLAVIGLIAGTSVASAEPTATAPAPSTTTPDVQTMIENLLRGFSIPGLPQGSPQVDAVTDTSQMIVVSVPEASSTTGTLTAFEKNANGQWTPVVGPVKAYVGEKGIGKAQDNVYRTPEGTFALDQAFGRQDNPGTKMPYKKVDAQDWWDSDMKSPTYNRMVRQEQSPGGDSENLYNTGPMYDYAVNIASNPTNTPGDASAIFLHVTDGKPTMGCVATDRESMIKILKWLDPAKHPKISIGVNAKTPTDIKNAPSTVTPDGKALDSNALTAIIDQFTSVIPTLLKSATGS